MTIASGTKLGRYDVRSQLGAGAMGEVYLTQDTVLGRRVASSRAEIANQYAVAPELDDLRSEPRFKEMLKRMNLPE